MGLRGPKRKIEFFDAPRAQKMLDRFHGTYTMEPNSGCWLWMGRFIPNRVDVKRPYLKAVMRWQGRLVSAPRFSFCLANGPIPRGAFICHHCDVSLCVNPKHLYAGDAQTNVDDMVRRNRNRKHGQPGGSAHNAKLADDQVRAIRLDTRSQRVLSRIYGVSENVICKVRRRETYRMVA